MSYRQVAARMISPAINAGNVVQYVYASRSDLVTVTANMLYDDSIPQYSEGAEILTLNITPKSASNILRCEYNYFGGAGDSPPFTMALFKDTGPNALAASMVQNNQDYNHNGTFFHTFVAGQTSQMTLSIRMGRGSATSTFYVNGRAGRKYGGVGSTTFAVWEIQT